LIAFLLGAAFSSPSAARAQHSGKLPKIGFLYHGTVEASQSRIAVVLEGLRTVGYRHPEQVALVARITDGEPTRLSPMAAELIEQKVDVVVAVSPAGIRSIRAITATIPIVAHDLETDPVASGLIESYRRPGGNVTGVFFDFPNFRMKWLELLQEALPNLTKLALLWEPSSGRAQLEMMQSAAAQRNLEVKTLEVRTSSVAEWETAFSLARRDADALLVLSSPLFGTRSNVLADLSLRYRLATVSLFPDFARAGGLIAYGPHILDTWRPIGVLVGKILQGTSPADLAVERPTKIELVVNLKTARAIGIEIPASILLRADEVID
jgi:putative tryptophan/tyrosine transport system substrate-binding protein